MPWNQLQNTKQQIIWLSTAYAAQLPYFAAILGK